VDFIDGETSPLGGLNHRVCKLLLKVSDGKYFRLWTSAKAAVENMFQQNFIYKTRYWLIVC
jgi:hypothetical protein